MRLRRVGTANALHHIDPALLVDPSGVVIVEMAPTGDALVLGSRQAESDIDLEMAAQLGFAVCRRRSGGGMVAVLPQSALWIDVLIGPGDPRWTEDVDHTAYWMGEAWIDALVDVGVPRRDLSMHRSALENRDEAKVVCFAGHGPGEVMSSGKKLVGISQRRGRWGARLQCQIHFGDERQSWAPALRSKVVDVATLPVGLVESSQAQALPAALERVFARTDV